MEKITKTAQTILDLVALITSICKTQLIIVYSYNMYVSTMRFLVIHTLDLYICLYLPSPEDAVMKYTIRLAEDYTQERTDLLYYPYTSDGPQV